MMSIGTITDHKQVKEKIDNLNKRLNKLSSKSENQYCLNDNIMDNIDDDIKNIGKIEPLYKLILHKAIEEETSPLNIIIEALEDYFKE